jgi:dTDP-4-amino-4,6-dideoxygalactose transaminase
VIPRYRPDLDLRAWRTWLTNPSARSGAVDLLATLGLSGTAHPFRSGREALQAWLSDLAARRGPGAALMSAQVCALVPRIARSCGFMPRFVDTDVAYPTPSAEQYVGSFDRETAVVVVAPLYGYLGVDWAPLLSRLEGIALVLDLAQGLGLEPRLPDLVRRADAIVYSFGLGKGLDTGGGLLVARRPLAVTPPRQGMASLLGKWLQAAVLRGTEAVGLYARIVKRLETAVEADTQAAPRPALLPEHVYGLWEDRLRAYRRDVERARTCAQRLSALDSVREACHALTVYGDPGALHLRQVLRLRDARRRSAILLALRQAGIDASPAGERLPDGVLVPNARAFGEDAIRLPFLGRLHGAEIEDLEHALVRSLSARV